MLELELQQYLLREYPQENARCEWKEYKNLKNSFCGDEKDDVISYVSAIANMEGGHLVIGVQDLSLEIIGTDTYNYDRQKAILRLTERCANLSTEGLDVEEFITDDTNKKVWIIHIPKHRPKLPVYAHNKAWQRIEDSLVELTQERLNAILEENSPVFDWSAEIIQNATLEDLDATALAKARTEYKTVHPRLAEEVDAWDDMELLCRAGLAIKGKLTRAAILLLGKETSTYLISPAVATITWVLVDEHDEKIDYEHFYTPFILTVNEALSKIRNLNQRILPGGTLFPDVVKQYDEYSIREVLHNCIAHQDYTMQERITMVEEPNSVTFANGGFFLPGTVRNAIEQNGPQKFYRNYVLCQGMVNFNMIDTIGTWLNGRRLADVVAQAIDGGATFVQLREKCLDEHDLLAEAEELSALCHFRHVPFVIDDNVEVALAAGADGVHVGQSDMAAKRARALLGPDKILGVSAHNAAEALAAQADGADYLGCGAAFVTGTKLDAHPVTAETMRAVTAAVNIPVVAIGGIDAANLLQLQGRGLAGVAVVSAIFAQADPCAASRELYRLAGQL